MAIEYILVDYENTQPKADEVALVRTESQRLWIFRGPGQKKYEAEFSEALLLLGKDVARVVRCEKSGANALDMHIAFELGRLAAGDAGATAVEFIVVSKDTDYEPLLQYLRKLGYSARREKTLTAAIGAPVGGARAKAAKEPRVAAKQSAPARKAANPPNRQANKQPDKQPAQQPARQTSKQSTKRASKQEAKPAAEHALKQSAPVAARQPAKKAAKAAPVASAKAPADHLGRARTALMAHPRSRPVRLGALKAWLQARRVPEGEVDGVIAALQADGTLRLDGSKLTYPLFA
ncbi:MAG: PIN domain-containing protein [Betaproteobacteria bacterium]